MSDSLKVPTYLYFGSILSLICFFLVIAVTSPFTSGSSPSSLLLPLLSRLERYRAHPGGSSSF